MSSGKSESRQSNAAFNTSNELSAIASQLFQDTSPVRDLLLQNIQSALSTGGVQQPGAAASERTEGAGTPGTTGTPEATPPVESALLTVQDLYDIYRRIPDGTGKLSDIPRLTRNLGSTFTLQDLQQNAHTSGLSTRSRNIFTQALGGLNAVTQRRSQAAAGGIPFSPLIAAARDTAKDASNQTLNQVREQLASANLLNTPFGQRALAEVELAGNQEAARIGPQIASDFIFQLAPQAAFGTLGSTVSGLSGAAGAQAQSGAALANSQGSPLANSLGNTLGAVAGGLAGNPGLFSSGASSGSGFGLSALSNFGGLFNGLFGGGGTGGIGGTSAISGAISAATGGGGSGVGGGGGFT